MKVAILSPIAWRTPPHHYGPWELVSSMLTEGLVKSGHDVTLFATKDSITSAKLDSVANRPYFEDTTLDAKVWESMHIANCMEKANNFDIIHNNFDFLPLTYSGLIKTPMITTIHGFSNDNILPVYERFNASTYYVSISNASRHPRLTYTDTVYHGIDVHDFTFQETPDDYLLFFGRIHKDKGTREAIEVAKATQKRLLIAGIIQDQDYFDTEVAPFLNDQIEYIGSVGGKERDKLLGGALALLHLISFPEPFGLSMVEAMATGTPVIAYPLGSIPEVVKPQVSGVIVKNQQEAVKAIRHISSIPRKGVREYVNKYFSPEKMISGYERVYEKILNQTLASS